MGLLIEFRVFVVLLEFPEWLWKGSLCEILVTIVKYGRVHLEMYLCTDKINLTASI